MKRGSVLLSLVITTELIKTRNTAAFWLSILYPFCTVLFSSMFHYSNRNSITPDQVSFINNFIGMASFFLTFYAVLMISFFCQIEHRNSMLKHLYALPIPRWAFYYGKLLTIILLLAGACLLLIVLVYTSLFIMGLISPKIQITESFAHGYLFQRVTRIFLSALAMTVIQYLLGMRIRNIVSSVSIGITLIILPVAMLFVLGITGLITNPNVLKWLPVYDPYAYPYSFVFNFSQGGSIRHAFYSNSLILWILAAIVISIPGYYENRKRNIT